jgi:hypothetical protein
MGIILGEAVPLAGLELKAIRIVTSSGALQEFQFDEKYLSIVFDGNSIIVLGQPPDAPDDADDDWYETAHNCDAMGCGWSHVLMRIATAGIENAYTDRPARIKAFKNSIVRD